MEDLKRLYSDRAGKMRKSEIRELLKVTQDPEVISFAGGLPNPKSFPIDDLIEVVKTVLHHHGHSALQYGTTQGTPELRESLVERVKKDGIEATPDNIVITSGSQQALDTVGKIFLNPQIWSIIAGSTTEQRQRLVWQIVEDELECGAGPMLLKPAYSKPDSDIGYLSRYAPGVRENGGIYTHAAIWSIWAAAELKRPETVYRLYKKLCPIYNSKNPDRYMAEPYVTPGNIDGQDSPHYGRGGWTWYTGSAAWLHRITFDYILGVQADYDGLVINPAIPQQWKETYLKRYFRGVDYQIKIINRGKKQPGNVKITMDGIKLSGNKLPVVNNKSVVQIIVEIE